jgi:hypothetical protein
VRLEFSGVGLMIFLELLACWGFGVVAGFRCIISMEDIQS